MELKWKGSETGQIVCLKIGRNGNYGWLMGWTRNFGMRVVVCAEIINRFYLVCVILRIFYFVLFWIANFRKKLGQNHFAVRFYN